jgi:uncharacterized membrane protein
MRLLARGWLPVLNGAVALFIAGAFAAPVLLLLGAQQAADALFGLYHLTCHQWAFRSFFLFGPQAIFSPEQLHTLGVDPFDFVGQPGLGWKMAFCERDLAIYLAALVVGLAYARNRTLPHMSMTLYVLLILPMALDGFTQIFGWRESTWELRVLTGLLFGGASVWLLYPRFDDAIGTAAPSRQYAPDNACAPRLPTPRG